jgi:hypothetical protein
MEADKSIGLVYGRAIHFFDEAALPQVEPGEFAHTRWSGAEWLKLRCRAGYNVITSPEVVVRGTVQRRVGGYNSELPHAGDLEMWLRIAAISNIAYIRRIPQAFYRVHPDSMMRTRFRGSFVDLTQRKAVFDSFFAGHRFSIKNADRLHDAACRALAREALWDACRMYDRNECDLTHAHKLEEFALAVYARATTLPESRGLRRRRRLGPVLCNRTQIFAGAALAHKVRRWALRERWQRWGI